jgi:hypothetical protein
MVSADFLMFFFSFFRWLKAGWRSWYNIEYLYGELGYKFEWSHGEKMCPQKQDFYGYTDIKQMFS